MMRTFYQLFVLLMLMTFGAANAATITVTSESDGPQPLDGLCTLREAVETANNMGVALLNGCDRVGDGIDRIVFDPNLSFISVTAGEIEITDELIIDGTIDASGQAANIVIDGDGDSRIFNITRAANHVTLNNLRLENGNAGNANGGAIFSQARLTVNDTRFAFNKAGGNGGAIHTSSVLTINRSLFYNNRANSNTSKGGAIFALREVDINNSTFSANQSRHQAGAIYIERGLLNIKHSHFEENRSVFNGGAIFSLFASVKVQNSSFVDNAAFSGGALFSEASVKVSRSTFFGNNALSWGGAIVTANFANVAITSSSFAQNRANNSGGAIHSSRDLTVTNSTLVNNSTLANPPQPALVASNNIKLESNILLGNTQPNCNKFVIEGNYNLLDDGSCGAGGTTQIGPQDIGIIDARLADVLVNDGVNATLVDNGCVTEVGAPGLEACVQTVLLQPTAMDAIDQGAALINDAVTNQPLTADQRQADFIGSTPDIGATELIAAQCGAADGVANWLGPIENLCQVGAASSVTDAPSAFTWQCSADTTASCTTPRQYEISYHDRYHPDHQFAKELVTAGSTTTLPAALERPHLAFIAWSTQSDGGGDRYQAGADFVMPNNNIQMYAFWEAYGICGNANNQATLNPPNANLCEFGGSSAVQALDEQFTWTCRYNRTTQCAAPRQYTLSYHANGGNNAPASVNVTAGNATATAPAIARNGFTFVGWNTQANGTGDNYGAEANLSMPASNVTLYAQWQANGRCGSANGNATLIKPNTNLCAAGAPSAVTEGASAFTWQCAGSAQICAAPRQYTLSYDANGGNNAPASVVVIAGNATATAPAIMRDGFVFGGWNTQANGAGDHYAAQSNINMPHGNVTLYAQWQPMAVVFTNGFE